MATPLSPLVMLGQGLERLRQLPEAIWQLADLFTAAGHELAIVGGPVRDALLDRPTADLDFATSARPDETLAILREWGDAHWDIGKAFGTIGALKKGAEDLIVEITTYRSDAYDPRSRKPKVAFGDDLDGDLARRDFSVNAMAVRLPDLTFVDPYDGLVDLAGEILRTPIEPAISFSDDPLRMLRAARFAAQLGFSIEPETFAAIVELASRIEIVSAERVQAELTKLMLAPGPVTGLEVLVDSTLADYVLPELPALRALVDEHRRHKDVYQHTLTVLNQAIAQESGPEGPVPRPDLVLRWAALLHDVGKVPTRRFTADGGVTFYGHDHVGARMSAARLRALRYDKQIVKDVARLVELHLRFHGYADSDSGWTDSAVRRYVTDAGGLLERLHILTRADCTTRNKRKAQWLADSYADLVDRIADLREKEELAAIRPDLDGRQIMELLDLPPGPLVGKAYRHMLAVRMERGPLGYDEAVAELKAWAKGALA